VRPHDDGQQRILQRVLLENIGEAGGDDGAEAPLGERPGSVLARAAAAEVIARQEHLNALRLGAVEQVFRVRIARRIVTPVIKKLLIETLLGSGLEEACRDDLVGIDVCSRAAPPCGFGNWGLASWQCPHVGTAQIIPARFLKTTSKQGRAAVEQRRY